MMIPIFLTDNKDSDLKVSPVENQFPGDGQASQSNVQLQFVSQC